GRRLRSPQGRGDPGQHAEAAVRAGGGPRREGRGVGTEDRGPGGREPEAPAGQCEGRGRRSQSLPRRGPCRGEGDRVRGRRECVGAAGPGGPPGVHEQSGPAGQVWSLTRGSRGPWYAYSGCPLLLFEAVLGVMIPSESGYRPTPGPEPKGA